MLLSISHCLLTLWLVAISPLAHGARILAVMAIPGMSHQQFMVSFIRALTKSGHEVVLYSNFQEKNTDANFTSILVKTIIPTTEEVTSMYETLAEINTGDHCSDHYFGHEWFLKMMQDDSIKRLISSNEKFDLVLSEAYMMQDFTLIFGHIFKAPTIAISAFPVTSLINNVIGNSLSIASVPILCSSRPFNMAFVDRFFNAFYLLRRHYIHFQVHYPAIEHEMRRFFKDMPPLMDMIQNVSLVFSNDHQTASFFQPYTPNLIPVAGIHIRPTQSLPQDIKKFMDGAKDGVVLFSLGTFVPEHLSQNDFHDVLKHVFVPLKQRVLWKTNKIMKNLPQNILTSDWLPQQDILAHNNCVLFITHGGVNSMIETIHHGVPVVVIPHAVDQPNNAMYLVEKKVGVMVEKSKLTRDTLSTAISTVLQDKSYARSMRVLSSVFRDRPMSPEASVVYWTEYVLRHGGASHLRPPPLPFYQKALLDVIAALLAATALVVLLAYYIVVKLLQYYRSTSYVRVKKPTKTE